jgi:hypothetical protein
VRAARSPWLPVALALAGATAYVLVAPVSADLAAQDFRARLFGRAGFAVWDGRWFGGHHVPGYSLLFPPLANALGPRVAGAVAAVVAAAAFTALARRRWGDPGLLAGAWFAAGTVAVLLSGRLTFAFGLAWGLCSLLALQRGRPAVAILLAAATALAGPVAALFLALAGAAVVLTVPGDRRAGVAIVVAALLPVALLALLFPEGGTEPFALGTLIPQVVLGLAGAALVGRGERTLRAGLLLYAALCVAAWLVPSPLGANAARLGPLLAGPLAAATLLPRRPVLLAFLALPLLAWQWSAGVRDAVQAGGDASTRASYYAPLLAFLARSDGPPARLEIPPTHVHWEADRVAFAVPLARGWERQLDRRDGALFYRERLDPLAYRRWLDALAVRWVALPDAPLDHAAVPEARLLRAGLPWLRPVWQDAHWRVWEVRGHRPLARGAATVTAYGDDSVTLRARRPGRTVIQIRWTPYWALAAPARGCVRPAPGGWTAVDLRAAGSARLVTAFAPGRARSANARCR